MLAVMHEGLLVGRTVRRVMSTFESDTLANYQLSEKRRGNCVSELDWFMSGELGEVTCRWLGLVLGLLLIESGEIRIEQE